MIGKVASIDRDPRQRFFYVPLPEGLKNRFTEMAKSYEGHEDVDHVTLLYVAKADEPVSTDVVTKIVSAAEAVGREQPPINAKVQGWAYFDGAKKDGKEVTALVALLDAPGLEDLHVALKEAMRKEGLPVAGDHGFTPHCTFAYLPHGRRVDDLPLLDGSFTVAKFNFVNREVHEVKLTGSLGAQAMKAAGFTGVPALKARPVQPLTLLDHIASGLSHDQAWEAMERQVMSRRVGNRMMPKAPTPIHQAVHTNVGVMHPGLFPGMSPSQVSQILQSQKLGVEAAMSEMAKGMEVEKEHGKGPRETRRIVEDHLREHPDYYTRLEKCLGEKAADHEHDRAQERSRIDPKYLRDLEAFLHDKRLPRIPLHMPVSDGSTIALSPAGQRHVVSTVLAPGMTPKGVPLSSVLHRVKPPAPRFRKEAVDGQALWQAVHHV